MADVKLERTRIRFLIRLGFFTGTLGWSLARIWPHWFLVQLPVPKLNAVTMWLLALTLLIWTLLARKRLQGDTAGKRMHPLVAARTVALAMAASRAGALVCGSYVGILAANLQLTRTPDVNVRILTVSLVAVASFVLTGTAVWLERLCQIKQPPSGDRGAEPA